jgi:hypothetical protein
MTRVAVQIQAQELHGQHSSAAAPAVVGMLPTAPTAAPGFATVNNQKTTQDISAMFGIIGRDVAQELPYVLANIASLAGHFKQSHVMFVENNSTDNTRAAFQAWGANFTAGSRSRSAKILDFQPASTDKKTLKVLAQARNRYIDQLALPEYAGVDF